MIKVKTKIGTFVLIDGELKIGSPTIELVYKVVKAENISPWQGPIDFAIAGKMCNIIGGNHEIVESDFPPEEEGVVN